jgi:hypothetical protein
MYGHIYWYIRMCTYKNADKLKYAYLHIFIYVLSICIYIGTRPRSVSDVTSDSYDSDVSPKKRMRQTKLHQKAKNSHLYKKGKHNDQNSEELEMPFFYDLDRQAEGSPFPVIDLETRHQRRIKLEKYLECDMKGDADHTDRPDLSYWVLEILTAIDTVENKVLNKIDKDKKNFILPPQIPPPILQGNFNFCIRI